MSWTEASRTGTAETDGDEDRRTGRANRGEQLGNLDRGQDNRETETTRGRDSRTGRGQGAPDGETDTGDGESWPEDGRTPPENPRRPLGRWQTQGNAPNPCAGGTVGPLVSPGWFSASGLEPSLQWGAVHKSRGRRNVVPTASASLPLAREVVKPVSAASLACPAKPVHRPSSRRCPRPTSCSRRSSRARHGLC